MTFPPGISRLEPRENLFVLLAPDQWASAGESEWHFRRSGKGPPLVLLHGIAASSYSFRDLIPRLAGEYETLAFDLQGFGYSGRPSQRRAYAPEEQADRIIEVLDSFSIDRFSVCGHSFGSVVALALADRYPDRVDRIVFVSPVTSFQTPPWYLRNGLALRLCYAATRLLLSRPKKFREIFGRAFYREEALTDSGSEVYRRLLLIQGLRESFFGHAVAISRCRDLPDQYRVLKHETMVLGGAEDAIVDPQSLLDLGEMIPRATVEILPGCGHSSPEEDPDGVADRIQRFFDGGTNRSTRS